MSIWFKQSTCALNIDSNGHQKQKEQKNTKKRFKTTKKPAQKHAFYISNTSTNANNHLQFAEYLNA